MEDSAVCDADFCICTNEYLYCKGNEEKLIDYIYNTVLPSGSKFKTIK